MQTTKKKPSLIFILVGAVLAGYLGYLINGAWTEGIAFNEFMDRFNEVCAVPFANYYNSNTVKAVAIALGIYAMAIVMYYTSQRNYMPGKEFGTARFENPKQVNKILADKDENFNRILSQNVKMSLDFRRLKLNGNILICGGSGAGKTFYEVKPNLDYADAAGKLASGEIDALFCTAGIRTAVIEELAKECDLRLLSIDDTCLEKLLATTKEYSKYVIPANTYSGQDEDVTTIGVKAVLLASDALSEKTVEKLTEILFSHAPDLAYATSLDASFDETDASSGVTIPFHPGAAAYYAGQGISVNTK